MTDKEKRVTSAINSVSNQISAYVEAMHEPASEKRIRRWLSDTFEDYALEVESEYFMDAYNSILADVSVTYNDYMEIVNTDPSLHKEWLTEERINKVEWNYWNYFASNIRGSSRLNTLKRETTSILSKIEDPEREGEWDNRGLVVGDIQSGKTSNFTGVIAKAIDVGYKAIIILSGLTDELRSQTQKRIEKDLISFRNSPKRGNKEIIEISKLTTPERKGDYKIGKTGVDVRLSYTNCVMCVVKKNASVLKNLYTLFKSQAEPDNGKVKYPLLMIDDEADNASINAKGKLRDLFTGELKKDQEDDASVVNAMIRAILSLFSRKSYIGYTATPYANIFGMPRLNKPFQIPDKKLGTIFVGEDLFPRNYIVSLSVPSNYYGTEKIFGFDSGNEDTGLDILRSTNELDEDNPDFSVSDGLYVGTEELPESLKYALGCFIVAASAKKLRKVKVLHSTMLIHVSRLVKAHDKIWELVSNYIDTIQKVFRFESSRNKQPYFDYFERIWSEEFDSKFTNIKDSIDDREVLPLSWNEVSTRIPDVIDSIKVAKVNGDKDASKLDYDAHEKGATYIVIGGDKLSRGLTLEGLITSYFLRDSTMYDTLLQMGRWFGYRDGYIDLCRVFGSDSLFAHFREISSANNDLRDQFREMASMSGMTPEKFGLKVRRNPHSDMLVTARNKQRLTTTREVNLNDKSISTNYLFTDDESRNYNDSIFRGLIKKLVDEKYLPHYSGRENGRVEWSNVDSSIIREYLLEQKPRYELSHCSDLLDYHLIDEFISHMNNKGELINWTVALCSGEEDVIDVDDFHIRASSRTCKLSDDRTWFEVNQRRLAKGSDEALDLNQKQIAAALEETNEMRALKGKKETNTPSPKSIRHVRPITNALLLMYYIKPKFDKESEWNKVYPAFMLSFANSSDPYIAKWQVNAVEYKNWYTESKMVEEEDDE